MNYAKGSEWRKWDLHIHSPLSLLNNQFPKLQDGESDWAKYIAKLESTDLAVIGITDYFTINGYKKVLEYKKQGRLTNLQAILPNIEFRLNSVISSKKDGKEQRRLNFHVIFSDEVAVQDIEDHFLHELYFYYEGNPQDKDGRKKLKLSNIEDLGKELISQHKAFQDGRSAVEIGVMNVVVSHEEITKLLTDESRFKGKYILVFPEELFHLIDWDGQDHHIRKGILQKSDMVFSSNPKTSRWCLGADPYTEGETKFINEFKTLKACIHGSDAHSIDKINYPCSRRGDKTHDCNKSPDQCDMRFCWIKADPTFEGLKQLLYEPSERVAVQDFDPTPIKTGYLIQKIEFPEAKINDELSMAKTSLEFNSNLVAVTGGKGAGKTAIVDIIANHFTDRVNTKDKNSFVKRIAQPGVNFATTITFKNGNTFTKGVTEPKFVENCQLAYISQGELEDYITNSSELNTYINNLIFESQNVADSVKQYEYTTLKQKIQNHSEELATKSSLIDKLEQSTREDIIKSSKVKETQAEAELKDLDQKISDIEKSLNADKIKLAHDKQQVISDLKNKRDLLISTKTKLKEASVFIQTDIVRFNQYIAGVNDLLTKLNVQDKLSYLDYPDNKIIETHKASFDKEITDTIAKIEKEQKEVQKLESEVQEHAKLLDKKREATVGLEKLKEQNKKLEDQRGGLTKLIAERKQLFVDLLTTVLDLKDKYVEIILAFSEKKADILSELSFEAEISFDINSFKVKAEEILDNRKVVINFEKEDCVFKKLVDKYQELIKGDRSMIPEVVDEVTALDSDLKSKIKLSHIVTITEFYGLLYSNYLSVLPMVKYKKTDLSKLSLGQKATVLVKIYLAWDDKPIIIDSHDDHLDNAYIMEELIGSIREAKKYRQIILVSNNGNVVINSDAEQIIVADRDSAGMISYISGSIENPIIREKSLKVLEGGRDAFKKRQQKYRIIS